MNLFDLMPIQDNMWKVALTVLILISTPAKAEKNGKIGGNGGQFQHITCPQNSYAIGMRIQHDNEVIIRVGLNCRKVDSKTGSAVIGGRASSISSSSRPGRGLARDLVRCPQGQFLSNVVRGFEGNVLLAKVVVGLEVQCVQFSDIDTTAGTSRRQDGQSLRLGAKFDGAPRIAGDYDANTQDMALTGLSVHSGYALDSVMVNAKRMPWVRASKNTQTIIDTSVSGDPTTPVREPNLYEESLIAKFLKFFSAAE